MGQKPGIGLDGKIKDLQVLMRQCSENEIFAASYLGRIVDKSGKLIPLNFTPIQQRCSEVCNHVDRVLGVPLRIINLKARQIFLSTYWTWRSFYRWLLSRQEEAILINFMGDTAKTTDVLRNMWNTYYDHLPLFVRMARPVTSRQTYRLPNGSRIRWHTALSTNRRSGQGSTSHIVVATEAPYYRDATRVFLALLNSVPSLPGTFVVLEGTAAGASGYFYEQWIESITHVEELCGRYGAENIYDLLMNRTGWGNESFGGAKYPNGYWDGSWIPLFFAWHENPFYLADPETEGVDMRALDERERTGVEQWGWTAEQIAWRRRTIRIECQNDRRLFDQEYPDSWRVAFLSASSPVFDPMIVEANMVRTQRLRSQSKIIIHPVTKKEVRVPYLVPIEIDWQREGQYGGPQYDPSGNVINGDRLAVKAKQVRSLEISDILVRKLPRRGGMNRYCIGADVSEGLAQGDYSVAYVYDRIAETFVAELRTRKSHADYAVMLLQLAIWYEKAYIMIERNSGHAVISEISRINPTLLLPGYRYDSGVPALERDRIGFATTVASKKHIVHLLTEYIGRRGETIDFPGLWQELSTFVRDERGKMGAAGKQADPSVGCYDDRVIAAALALVADEIAPEPIGVTRKELPIDDEEIEYRPIKRWLLDVETYENN